MPKSQYKLRLMDVCKSFPGVKALDHVCVDVLPGTVHILVGENGAGKSTLMKILNGMYTPDEGSVELDGTKVNIENPIQAASMGIAMIYQELHFMPDLTVEEYMFLAKEPLRFPGVVNWQEMTRLTTKMLEEEEVAFTAKTKMRDLSVSDIQLIEIMKATHSGASVIIMDEPTSSISAYEVERLFATIAKLKESGITIIYISHKMEEIFRIGEYITVIRDGRSIESRAASDFDNDSIITMMVGRELDKVYPKETVPLGEECLMVEGLTGGERFQNISFHVKQGEIVGFAGLVGAGRTEVMRAVVGMEPYHDGHIEVLGKKVKIRSVGQAADLGVMMAAEDRKRYGAVLIRSIRENIALSNLKLLSRFGFLKHKKESGEVLKKFKELNVKAPTIDTEMKSLSGGNQQKVVLAKLLLANPRVLILDEPTRGIDVGAKFEIYKIMGQIARSGVGIIMVSSELPELLGMCDRIYVMREHCIVGMCKGETATQDQIMRMATGA